MTEELDALKSLAIQDKQILEIRRKLNAIPEQLAEARKQLDAEQVVLDEVKVPHDSHVKDILEKESTISIALETIEKFEEHMKNVTTQAEYLTARKQIDEAKRLNLRLEDEIVELKAKRDELAPTVTERQQQYDNVMESYRTVESGILKEQAELEGQITELVKAKAEAESVLGPRTLAYYKRLSGSGRIPALVSADGGICGGCSIALPPQVYNQLIANPTVYASCTHCNRMIYYEAPPATDEAGETISA